MKKSGIKTICYDGRLYKKPKLIILGTKGYRLLYIKRMHISLPVAVVSIVIKNDKVLLLKRQNTPWMNGYWGLPGGRLDAGEGMLYGALRELEEEVSISLKEGDIIYKGIIHHSDERGERIYFIIASDKFDGEATNNEPEKCSELGWFYLNELPLNITPQVEICMEVYKKGMVISEYGF